MLHTSPRATGSFVPGKKIFLKGFYHIWSGQSSWSCDPDAANKLSFPQHIEDLYEIWLWLAQQFLRRKCLKRFSYMWNKWPLRPGHFWPQSYNLNNHGRGPQDKTTPIYQRPRPLVSDKVLKILPIGVYIWRFRQRGQSQWKVIIFSNFIEMMSPLLHIKLEGHWPFDSKKNF